MRTLKYSVILFLILAFAPAYTSMLTRNTFEEYEGSTPQECGWTDTAGGYGIVIFDEENPDTFQTQRHGGYSLRIFDPNSNSYGNAHKTFTNSSSEYMIEFYIWIYHSHAPIDSFPLCILFYSGPFGLPTKTDIALVIDTVLTPPDEQLYSIHVEDASGFHSNQQYLYSTDIDTWHKIQIHRHSTVISDVVDLYFDGNTVGTYTPMNMASKSTRILFGTGSSDSLADGELFYDDVIVTTVPSGEHPRLFFDSSFVDTLKNRMTDGSSTISVRYDSIWDQISSWVDWFSVHDTIICNSGKDTLLFPYSQPKGHVENEQRWLSIATGIERKLNIFSFYDLMKDSAAIREKARAVLLSLCNDWQQWTDPDLTWSQSPYSFHDTGILLLGVATAYDLMFNQLSNYEKMTIQNSIITLGLTQSYLRALYTPDNLTYANVLIRINSGLGIGTLVTDSASLDAYLDSAEAKVSGVLQQTAVADPSGGWSEGIAYAEYMLQYLIPFMAADSSLENSLDTVDFIENTALWRVHGILPVEQGFDPDTFWRIGEVNFCDYRQNYMKATWPLYWLAAHYQDSVLQWYLDHRHDENKRFFPFLWFDADLDTLRPPSLDYECEQLEWTILRTGWGMDDCVFAMKGDSLKHHTQHDRNSFIFGTKGRWFIGDWGYEFGDSKDSSALYHNILITNNDTLTIEEGRAEITKFYGDSDYGYLMGDASACYEDLQKWTREVIFLKNGGHFVVKDWVKAESGQVDTLRWQVHSYIVSSKNDSLTITTPLATSATISKDSTHLRMEFHKPVEVSIDTTTPFFRDSYKRISEEIVDAEGIDSLLFLTSYVVFGEGENCPEVSDISADSMYALFIDTEEDDNVILFSKRENEVIYTKYDIAVPSGYNVLNVLADMAGGTYKIDDEYPLGVSTTTSYRATTSEGTLDFEISGSGTHRITVTKQL